ncbi:MAG: hypothetical protein ACK5TR_06235 [Alphaproteobacteria bacterium]|jgi:hypothetical protein
MKKLRRLTGIMMGVSLLSLCVADICWGLAASRPFLNEGQAIHQTLRAKTPMASNALALTKEMMLLEDSLDKLSDDKDHNEGAQKIIISAQKLLDDIRVLSKQTADLEKEQETQRKKLAALDYAHAGLLKNANSLLVDLKKTLQRAEELTVEEPETFPERCFVMTDPEAVQKAGLKPVIGIIETFNRVWVLTSADAKSRDGVMRYHLSAQVGLTGSKDHNAGLVIRSHTPQSMVVTGLLDPQTNTIMCVSPPRSVGLR